MEFLRRSCGSYDDGFEGEACRLAVTLRVLLHNTRQSTALLTQAGMLTEMSLFADSSQPINGENLLPNPGLVIMRLPLDGAANTFRDWTAGRGPCALCRSSSGGTSR